MNRRLLILVLATLCFPAGAKEINLAQNPGFETASSSGQVPDGYDLGGAATWGRVGGADEITTRGILFPGEAKDGGSVSQTVQGIDQTKGKWLTFRFRGLAEDGFAVTDNALAMKIEFYSRNGTNFLDGVTRLIWHEIETDRANLTVNGDYGKGGAAVWRSYELEELMPFPEVDTVKITVLYKNGAATSPRHSLFFIDDFSLVQRPASLTGKVDPAAAHSTTTAAPVDESKLMKLGGRWSYLSAPNENVSLPLTINANNADRLFYKSDRYINPFANNMTAWLRPGYKDVNGNLVTKDTFVPDNVVLIFKGDGFLTMKAKNIPNHPTAKFPDTYGTQGYNPSYIQELDKTYRLPLDPTPDPNAKVVDRTNSNRALNMGEIGVAVNGVVFYNPFDAQMSDASSIMDRCCGHPSPDNRYHYHKYPVCVNTPFVDKGDAPSEVIGFAFDGLPIYGPYQSAGIMAKDSTTNPLNAFNASYDDVRGWHYNVTPGKFPYIIGGYFAKVERSNLEQRPMRPPGGNLPGGPPPGGRPPPPWGMPPPPDF
jgi:YHYH protein